MNWPSSFVVSLGVFFIFFFSYDGNICYDMGLFWILVLMDYPNRMTLQLLQLG
jgi:hypothetical protein